MWCSGNESSQIEHFRPKAVFPQFAMTWENFLWSCGICNHAKGDRFPPDTEPGAPLIDPTLEDPWRFFYIDDFGCLCPVWNPDHDALDPRAANTIRILALDRDALQQTRQDRLNALKQEIEDTM
ncbi:MAG: hypothetical protein HQM03_01985 [Magnetococcales bacterium]|nr:hypothetical protein [Magnetococcales bacterium]